MTTVSAEPIWGTSNYGESCCCNLYSAVAELPQRVTQEALHSTSKTRTQRVVRRTSTDRLTKPVAIDFLSPLRPPCR